MDLNKIFFRRYARKQYAEVERALRESKERLAQMTGDPRWLD